MATVIMAIPLMPAFETPITKVAVSARAHAVNEISDVIDSSKVEV